VVSFDIDGTLQFGDPAGPVPVAVVRAVLAAGHVVGSASDRTRADQRRLWAHHRIEVAFLGGKHHLADVRQRFPAGRYVHLGDTDVDEHFARRAGFDFVRVDEMADPHDLSWL
jgi:hypothetical protein